MQRFRFFLKNRWRQMVPALGASIGFLIVVIFLWGRGNFFAKNFPAPVPPAKGNSFVVDTETREVILFSNGVRRESLPIVSLPPPTSPWHVSRGTFSVVAKEDSHVSALSKGVFPNAISLGGDVFISGPHTADMKKRQVGGVELAALDAKKLFEFADIGMKALVVGDGALGTPVAHAEGVTKLLVDTFPTEFKKKSLLSDAYLIGDLDTGEVILSQKETTVRPIASVSKLFTTLVAKDLMASSTQAGSRVFGIPYEKLLYPLLMESSNAAADELANIPGRVDFISAMNDKAKSLGLLQTSFRDPSGLSPKNVSTAADLFKLAQDLYTNHQDIISLTDIPSYGQWRNLNYFIRVDDPRYVGGKVGYIPESGQTWVAFFSFPISEFENKHIAVVLLRSPDRVRDAKTILSEIARELYRVGGEGQAALINAPAKITDTTHENTLVFVGDIMLDRGVRAFVDKNCSSDYSCLFQNAYFLKSADITFGNLEGPVSDKGYDLRNLYSFRMSTTTIPILREAGFDALSVANNHVGDWGRTAFTDTLARLRDGGILPVGGGDNEQDARQVKIIEKNGVKFGYLGFTDVGPDWLGEPANLAVINLASDPDFSKIISKAKSQVDVLVVSFHWGVEYQADPMARQTMLAHAAVDAGANVVVGSHPHVREPIERYNGAVIAYSLGNFIFDQGFSDETKTGGVLSITFNGTTTVDVLERIAHQNAMYQPELVGSDEF